MGFKKAIKDDALVAAARHCCVCHEYKGLSIEVHHIIPKEQGGKDDFDNAIPLCFECHADAGHYHAQHPKGSKLSPEELRKHRDMWYEIVRSGKASLQQLPYDKIICQYIVVNNRHVVNEILNGKVNIPHYSKVFSAKTKISTSVIDLFMTDYLNGLIDYISYDSLEDYLKKHPDAQKIESKDSYYLYKRPISEKELILNDSPVFHTLIKDGLTIDEIIQRYANSGGCDDGISEYLIAPQLILNFLSIYNNTEEFMHLSSLDYIEGETNQMEQITLPQVMIPPKAVVYIPIAVYAEPMEKIVWKEHSVITSSEESYIVQEFKKVGIDFKNSKGKLHKIGNYMEPIGVNYSVGGKKIYTDIHQVDMENLYKLDQYLCIGSCPHLFLRTDNGELQYLGEILQRGYRNCQTEVISLPDGADSIIIAELECETTFINSIYVDSSKVIEDKKLEKGDYILIDVHGKSQLIIEGSYESILDPQKTFVPLNKDGIIKTFYYKHST